MREIMTHTRTAGDSSSSSLAGFHILLGTRQLGAPWMCWINNMLEWSGKTYMELKELAQDRITWKRSWNFSASAVKLLSRRWHTERDLRPNSQMIL